MVLRRQLLSDLPDNWNGEKISSGLVALHNRVSNSLPGKGLLGGHASVAAHPAGPFEIGEQGAEAPADGINRGINFQPGDVVPDKLVWPAVPGGHHRLAGSPPFQSRDSKRLVPARQADRITGFVQIHQVLAVVVAEEARGMSDS